jgi:hypothetical protein
MIRKIKLSDLSTEKQRQSIRKRMDQVRSQLAGPNLTDDQSKELREQLRKLTQRLRE